MSFAKRRAYFSERKFGPNPLFFRKRTGIFDVPYHIIKNRSCSGVRLKISGSVQDEKFKVWSLFWIFGGENSILVNGTHP